VSVEVVVATVCDVGWAAAVVTVVAGALLDPVAAA
jgi:hypothetical protein